MPREHEQLDPIELELLGLAAAEQAGLFQRTKVDSKRLLAEAPRPVGSTGSWRNLRRALPVAAGIALAVSVGTWMFGSGADRNLSDGRLADTTQIESPAQDFAAFQRCFDGPSKFAASECAEFDYDADGSVNMADFQVIQLADARVRP